MDGWNRAMFESWTSEVLVTGHGALDRFKAGVCRQLDSICELLHYHSADLISAVKLQQSEHADI